LLGTNPFPDRPPRYVRAVYYTYGFTTHDERKQTGRRWTRERLGLYVALLTNRQ
jgi:lipase maturation factor 1